MPRGRDKYLRLRDYRERSRERDMDYRNNRRDRDYRDRDMESRYKYDFDYDRDRDYRDRDRDRGDYDMRGDYRRDYRDRDMRNDYRDRDYRDYRDYNDYAEEDLEEKYKKDLKKWIEKLKKYDRFGLSKDQVIQKAKEMDVKFKDYDEDEFYAIYLMHISDYPQIANDSRMYLAMAKAWLEDKDIKIEPSEKVCKYLYEIVMAEEE